MNETNSIGNAILIILTSVIGVSILSVILSNNAATVNVIKAASSGFGSILQTAVSPVTGGSNSLSGITNSLNNLGGFGNLGTWT